MRKFRHMVFRWLVIAGNAWYPIPNVEWELNAYNNCGPNNA